jgi:DNA-binding GntR family transcriptional regulator
MPLLRESVLHGDVVWEAEVLAAHHVLSKTPLPADPRSDAMQQWSVAHEAFHQSLLAACPSQRLRRAAETLRDEAELYRRWSGLYSEGLLGDPGGHAAMAEAALEHDVDRAVELLRDHIAHTVQILVSGFEASAGESIDLSTQAPLRK